MRVPLSIAETLNLENRVAFSIDPCFQSLDLVIFSYREKSSCLESGMVTPSVFMTELNFSLRSLTYSENTLAQSWKHKKEEFIYFSSQKQKGGTASASTHLCFVGVGRFLLFQVFHQSFILLNLSQTDPATNTFMSQLWTRKPVKTFRLSSSAPTCS